MAPQAPKQVLILNVLCWANGRGPQAVAFPEKQRVSNFWGSGSFGRPKLRRTKGPPRESSLSECHFEAESLPPLVAARQVLR